MSGHQTRAVFDRYNIVSVDDLREAVERIEAHASPGGRGHVLDTIPELGLRNDEGPLNFQRAFEEL